MFLNLVLAGIEVLGSLSYSVNLRILNYFRRGICHSFWLENFKNNLGLSKLIRLWIQNKAKVLVQSIIKQFHSYFEKTKPRQTETASCSRVLKTKATWEENWNNTKCCQKGKSQGIHRINTFLKQKTCSAWSTPVFKPPVSVNMQENKSVMLQTLPSNIKVLHITNVAP